MVGNGVQRATVGTHHLGHVASRHFLAGEHLESPYHGVVFHGAALHHYARAKVVVAMQLEHLEQAVAHHRVAQSCRYVLHRGALTHHLLHLRVHEHRAACAEVARLVGMARGLGEVIYLIAQSLGESLNERSAARRARLVELHACHGAVVHENGFHVLSADVEDEAHVGH